MNNASGRSEGSGLQQYHWRGNIPLGFNAVIRVYDEAGYVIETHEHTGDFRKREGGYYVKQKPPRDEA
jgi:hypothetical protein